MTVEELISETMCIQQRIVLKNNFVSCAFSSAHARMSSYFDVPIRVVAVASIWRQCRHRLTVLLPVSRSSMLCIALFNLSSVVASSISVGHCGLADTTLELRKQAKTVSAALKAVTTRQQSPKLSCRLGCEEIRVL